VPAPRGHLKIAHRYKRFSKREDLDVGQDALEEWQCIEGKIVASWSSSRQEIPE
jgi:hypothetical protein